MGPLAGGGAPQEPSLFWAPTALNQYTCDDLLVHAVLDSAKFMHVKVTQNALLMLTTA